MNLRLSFFSLCIAVSTAASHAQFSDGVLDTAFDGDGIVQTDFGSGQVDNANAVAAQPDGKTVVAGRSDVDGFGQVALARYTVAGALDPGFGSGGRVLTDVGPGTEMAYAMEVQPDGKIVVAGITSATISDFLVLRYTPAGVLDATFGTGGVVTIPFAGGYSGAYTLALQNDGKIVVAGYANISGNSRFAVVRLTDAGVLDATFSGDGKSSVDIGTTDDQVRSIALQADGKIVLLGEMVTWFSNVQERAMVRLTSSGEIDAGFGTAGKVIFPEALIVPESLVIQPSGEIIVGGSAKNGGQSDIALVRYTSSGAIDGAFGMVGKVLTSLDFFDDYCIDLALQSDGKILAAGGTAYAGARMAVVRYTASGALDASFGSGGIAMHLSNAAQASSMALHGNGRIALTGKNGNGPLDFQVHMYRVPLPDIAVAQASAMTDGSGAVAFGAVPVGSSSPALTFTITNPGTAPLNDFAITRTGADAADFDVSAISGTSIPEGGGSATFTVTFSPESGGVKTATLQIASNVSGAKNPFDIALTATGIGTNQDTDNDGLNDLAEFQMAALGFNWQVAQNALVDTYFATANGAGLFTSSQVGSLKMPTPVIGRNPGNGFYTLQLGVEKGTSPPGNYESFPISAPQTSISNGKLELQFTSPDDAAFFRILTQ